MKKTLTRTAAIATLALMLSGQSYGVSDLDAAFGRDTLVIAASEHACYVFDIWVAETRAQQMRGLMHVREMPDNAGMLFVYSEPAGLSMWMKNTYIPLDMLFIRNDGTVSSIVANTEPLSLRSVSAVEPVSFVLELNAGTAEALKLGPGNQVFWFNVP